MLVLPQKKTETTPTVLKLFSITYIQEENLLNEILNYVTMEIIFITRRFISKKGREEDKSASSSKLKLNIVREMIIYACDKQKLQYYVFQYMPHATSKLYYVHI